VDQEAKMDDSIENLNDNEIPEVPPAVVAAGIVAAAVALGIIGWMLFRSRRPRPLMERLQGAIPGRVRELPTELQARIRRAK